MDGTMDPRWQISRGRLSLFLVIERLPHKRLTHVHSGKATVAQDICSFAHCLIDSSPMICSNFDLRPCEGLLASRSARNWPYHRDMVPS